MDLLTIFIGALIFVGIILMLLSIIRLIKLFKSLSRLTSKNSTTIYLLLKVHLVLLIFFFIGYIVVFVSTIFHVHLVSELFVSLIFIFGAVFVLLGLILQSNLLNEMKKSNLQAIKVLVSAAEARDPYTMGHSEHVANLLGAIFNSLPRKLRKGINYDLLRYAGLLHDIGKIGIPENILNNPGQLNDEEMEIMKQHPVIGESIINHVDFLQPVAKWVLYHHERVDGLGYNQLKDEEIPIVSRMMAIADTYSSMVTERKYRPVKTHEEAVQILKEIAGHQLDSVIVDYFCNIDYNIIKECTPKNQSVRVLYDFQGINKETIEYFETLTGGNILDKDTGIICIKKYINLAHRNEEALILYKMEIEGLRENKNIDYHIIDEISINIENIINKRIRKSDIVSRLSGNSYIFLFQRCTEKKANEILRTIQSQIENLKILERYNKKIKFIDTIIQYDPKDDNSYNFVMNFLNLL